MTLAMIFLLITVGLLAFPTANIILIAPHLSLAGIMFIISLICFVIGR